MFFLNSLNGAIAQLVERQAVNLKVVGAKPTRPAIKQVLLFSLAVNKKESGIRELPE